MAAPRYQWRGLTATEKREVLENRKRKGAPWHGPPHRASPGNRAYFISAACYEHSPVIGHSDDRMDDFSSELLQCFEGNQTQVFAWVVLPNHYHVLVQTENILSGLENLGTLHGRSSFRWNGEEGCRGRKVFFRAVEREIRSNRHFWSTMNYVFNNAVRHGYVENWSDWPWSNAREYLEAVGREKAAERWREYPVRDYGAGWDDPEL